MGTVVVRTCHFDKKLSTTIGVDKVRSFASPTNEGAGLLRAPRQPFRELVADCLLELLENRVHREG
jgi:hypothetical protein